MTPTSFDFTVTMPGDARLAGAIRQLAAHAAGYAQLAPEAKQHLAGHVASATEAAIAAAMADHAPIEFRFSGGEDEIEVVISCPADPSAPPPPSMVNGQVSVQWSAAGTRHVCHIRQQLPA